METAIEQHLQNLTDKGLLTSEHVALVQLAKELARAIGVGAISAKTSLPMVAAQLLEVLDRLPSEETASLEDLLAAVDDGDDDGPLLAAVK